MRSLALLVLVTAVPRLFAASGCSGHANDRGPGGSGGSSNGGSGGQGGASGHTSSGGAFNCDYKEAGFEYCYSYTGLTAAQTTAEQDACMAYPASTTPSSCPSANQSGCCEN